MALGRSPSGVDPMGEPTGEAMKFSFLLFLYTLIPLNFQVPSHCDETGKRAEAAAGNDQNRKKLEKV